MSSSSSFCFVLRATLFCGLRGRTSAAPRALSGSPNRSPNRGLRSGGSRLNLQTPAAANRRHDYKTMDDLPGPNLATTAYWLFVKGYADKSHAMQVEHQRIYGPIWRSQFGPFNLINVAAPELIEQVIRQEGRYPTRSFLAHWKEYRDMRGQAYGLHVDKGPEWHRLRSVLNPKLLKLQEVSMYAPIVHDVVSDLLKRMERLRLRSQDQATIFDLNGELYKFGFEGASSIVFETRLGCLQDEIPPDTVRFISAVGEMLTLSETVLFFPRWTRSFLPFWRRFVKAWDDLYDVATQIINKKVEEINTKVNQGEQVKGMYLTHLLSSNKLSLAEVYITITELLLGGVDTTSNTLCWTLYELARDEEAQEQLYKEVTSVCPGRQLPSTEDLNRMPYLKAVIKEILRLYPVVPGNGRLTVENEVIIDNYWFPKKTQFHLCHYATSHDEKQFPEPEKFIPNRWIRHGPNRFQHHPFSSIPFGVGVRACLGRRIAELEMYFVLSRIMQHYKVVPETGGSSLLPKTRTLLIPSKPVNLRFILRD
ncbi:LOW QUALITY PROTEIN: cytochrome P450 27C1 [Scleropages formosus]|uniref:LOW QUALITY PROTEIN: cytochrome P450 27C1 n=1 Tax=Scleropages formosus TaxID=113540 RepID=UPI003D9504B2